MKITIASITLLTALFITLGPASAQIPTGASFWLRADTGVTYSSTVVSEWKDQSGSSKSAYQTIPINEPTIVPDAINKLPVIRFDGRYQYFDCAPIFPVAKDYTISIVARVNDYSKLNNIVSGYGHAIYLGGGYSPIVLNDTTQPWKQVTSTIPLNGDQPAIITVSYVQATQIATIYINGEFAGSGQVATNKDSKIFIGAFQEGQSLFAGDIAEIVLYPSALVDSSRKHLESYLFNKYAISPNPAPDSIYTSTPRHLQFYPREDDDSATVLLAGNYPIAGYDSMYLKFFKNGALVERVSQPLVYEGGHAAFSFKERIHAELSEYSFSLAVKSSVEDRLIAFRDSIVCGDVILINGQSNSINNNLQYTNEFYRTFGKNFSNNKADTAWEVSSTAVDFGGGAEVGSWGLRLQELLRKNYNLPSCVINGGVGGTPIEQHLPDPLNATNLSTIYGSMLYRAIKSDLATKAKVLFWYQGESNTISNYDANFHTLYTAWKQDYPNVRKIYVMQVRPGCTAGFGADVRELLRTLQDEYPNIESVSTMGLPGHDGCHFLPEGYIQLGDQLFRLLTRDFYGSKDVSQISSPNIHQAYYTNSSHTGIGLTFMPPETRFVIPGDSTIGGITANIKDYFFLDDTAPVVESITTDRNRIFLTLKQPSQARFLNYLPDKNYNNTSTIYEGPWLENERGVGAFSFYHFPIVDSAQQGVARTSPYATSINTYPNPCDHKCIISYTVATRTNVSIILSDMLGRELCSLERGVADVGEHLESLDLTNLGLANGLYVCTLQAGGSSISTRIVVNH